MSRVAWRIVAALMLAAVLPLMAALGLALGLTEVSLGVGLNESVKRGLRDDLPLYRALFGAKKQAYEAAAHMLARDPGLARAGHNEADLRAWARQQLDRVQDLRTIEIRQSQGSVVEQRPVSVDSKLFERKIEITSLPGATLRVEFRLPGTFIRGLDQARDLAETYEAVSAARNQITRSLLLGFALTLGLVIAGAVLAGLLLARSVTRRVAELARATAAVADGDFSTRVRASGRDEIAELAGAFNAMVAELEDRRDRIVYLEKISGWQQVARRLAHEIKNPLTPIVLAVQQLDQKKPDDPIYARLVQTSREVIEEEVASLRHLVEEFSAFAKLPEVQVEPVPLADYVREVCTQIASTEPLLALDLDALSGEERIALDRMLFRRVLSNLLLNAVQAAAGDPVRVEVRLQVEPQALTLHIDDDGPGLDKEVADHIFEPYVTTKAQGTGLGLAIVKKIVLQHNGGVTATRSPALGGARFTLWLPRLVADGRRNPKPKAKKHEL